MFTTAEAGQLAQQVASPEAIEFVKAYLMDHLADHVKLSSVARLVALSPFYLSRLFKAQVGIPPYRYLLRLRIQRARELLAGSSLSVTQICHRVGFSSLSHFINTFHRHTGMTPREYREAIRTQSALAS